MCRWLAYSGAPILLEELLYKPAPSLIDQSMSSKSAETPTNVDAFTRWDEYTQARDERFAATDTAGAPWYVARSEDKKRVRLNLIRHLLEHVPHKQLPTEKAELPKREVGRYKPADYPFKYVPERD